jgi:hypothetical protein
MTSLTSPQQAEFEKPVTRVVFFFELQLSTGTQRINSSNQKFTWGGFDWSGLGQVLSFGNVSQDAGGVPSSIDLIIAAAQPAWLALAVGPVTEYRGRVMKMYICPLDESFMLVGTPVLCWAGIMDTNAVNVAADGGGTIVLKCESRAYALKRRPVLRVNAEQHKRTYPLETGFDYLTDLIGKPQRWLSKKFQAR